MKTSAHTTDFGPAHGGRRSGLDSPTGPLACPGCSTDEQIARTPWRLVRPCSDRCRLKMAAVRAAL